MLASRMMYEHSGKRSSIVSTLKADSAILLKEKILAVSSNKSEIFSDQDADSDWDELCKTPYQVSWCRDVTVYGE